ncbi:MAG TPA: rubredoxin, partial [Geobacteraceae bacterium]|nr:rubredoxin [Geobacteraceae bacterium]
MSKYQCRCQYVYDPAMGDMTQGISAGTSFAMLPEDWICPTCGCDKSHFLKDEGRPNSEQGHPTIKVNVRCFSTLATESCGFRADKQFELYEGSTVHDLTEKMEIPLDAVKIVFRNHREVGFWTVLNQGDRIG